MNTIQHKFSSVESDNFFLSLAEALNTEPVNGTIHIPSFNGSGFISRKMISDDIVLLCWDIRLNRDMAFSKRPVLTDKENQSFVISYLLTNDTITIISPTDQKTRLKANRNILFMSSDAGLQFEIAAGENFKVVNICVPMRWLKNELSAASPAFLNFINKLGEKDHPTVFMETSPPSEYRLLSDMNIDNPSAERGNLGLKAKVFSLVADFLSRIFDHSAKEVLESKMVHHEKMMEVEGFLKQHLENTLPDIATIARQMALSVSTLKRHFKMMFGKSVYEYYLELKMEHARQLLMERNLSVNEVANMLEYEKVSCFIDIFKKHHGHSPGAIKKLA